MIIHNAHRWIMNPDSDKSPQRHILATQAYTRHKDNHKGKFTRHKGNHKEIKITTATYWLPLNYGSVHYSNLLYTLQHANTQ